jgi:hypothetical protein
VMAVALSVLGERWRNEPMESVSVGPCSAMDYKKVM